MKHLLKLSDLTKEELYSILDLADELKTERKAGIKKPYLEGKTLHTVKDGRLYGGSLLADGGKNGIKGEFLSNGIKNNVPMEKGTIVMARGENYDSAYGQFFILTEDQPELEGEYAAFGKITDLEILEKIMKDVKVDEHGIVKSAPKILTVSLHDAHH